MLPLCSELTFDKNDSTGVVHDQSLFLSKSIDQHLLKAKAGLMVSKELAKGSGSYISGKRSFPGRLRFRAVRTPTSKLDTKKKAHVNKLHKNDIDPDYWTSVAQTMMMMSAKLAHFINE